VLYLELATIKFLFTKLDQR